MKSLFQEMYKRYRERGLIFVADAILIRLKKWVYSARIPLNETTLEFVHLGTPYGGKTFLPLDELEGSTIISCGLGEDATFDVEFVEKYSAKTIIVDPTPRAKEHYKGISKRFGKPPERGYTENGAQVLNAYDLEAVKPGQMAFEEYALWVKKTTLKFYAPVNPLNVSHSLQNIQNNYSQSDEYSHIYVETKTLSMIMEENCIRSIPLLKLDIEGAEIEVLLDMIEKRILPTQICVEFDGLNFGTKRALKDVKEVDAKLREAGYLCYNYDGAADYLYVLKNRLDQELLKLPMSK